jgi:CHAT domain-containing protein
MKFIPVICLFVLLVACRQSPESKPEISEQTIVADTIALLKQSDSLFRLGKYYDSLKDNARSLSFDQKSLAIKERFSKDPATLLENYLHIARLYLNEFKYDVADKYLEKARLMISPISDLSTEIDLYLLSASCKVNLQDFPSANSMLQKVIALLKNNFPEDEIRLSRAYQLTANNFYYQHNYGEGSNYLRKLILLIPPDRYAQLVSVHLSSGVFFGHEKKYDQALKAFNKALDAGIKLAGPDSDPVAMVYVQAHSILLEMGRRDSALYCLAKNLYIREKIYGEKNVNTFGARYSLGQFFYQEKQYDSALYYYQKSLISLVQEFDHHNAEFNPRPDPTELNSNLVIALTGKANALAKSAEIDSVQTTVLDRSLKTYLLADSVFAVFRSNLMYDDPQLKQLETGYLPYDEIVTIASRLYELNKEQKYLNIALNVMERSRAVLLRTFLSKAEAYNSAGIKSSFKEKESALARQRASTLQQIYQSKSAPAVVDSLNKTLLALDDDWGRLRKQIQDFNPNYFLIRYANPDLSIEDVQVFLKERNSVLLEYLWSNQCIYAMRISENSIKIKPIKVTTELNNALNNYASEFRDNGDGIYDRLNFKKFCQNSSFLYNTLLKDFLVDIDNDSHIIISADGPLSSMSFDALITRKAATEEVNYHLPYLVLEHPISYAYSTGILLRQSALKRKGRKLLAFGYAGNSLAVNTRSNLGDLPGTEREINAIRDVMKNHVNKYRLGSEASEDFFKREVKNFDILHLAIHGVGDTTNALNSRLVFRNDSDSVEDGDLYAHELYDLDLTNLDLAVLSACETGVGKQQSHEGVMSIARGFAYAGSPSIVISLWKIDDKTTSQIMKGFYQYLSSGELVDDALAKAKKDYLKEVGEFNSHPFFWASFMQVGNSQRLDTQKPNWWSWVLGFAFLTGAIYLSIKIVNR